MIKGVIFDLDGLLIDSERTAHKNLNKLLEPCGVAIDTEEYVHDYLGKTVVEGINRIAKLYRKDKTPDELLDIYLQYEKTAIEEGIPLKAGALELLEYLKSKSIKIALASSSLRERAVGILKSHNILDYFDELVFGYEVEKGKPAPDIFLKACEKINVKPSEAIVLEDSEAGIQAGFSANIPVFCIPDIKKPSQPFAEKATKILNSLNDVRKLI